MKHRRRDPDAPETGATIVLSVHAAVGGHGRRRLEAGSAPLQPAAPVGRVPRVARMVALAHRWQGLIREGAIRDQTDLARLVGVSRVRVTQVMDLLRLAPDIQDAALHLPPVTTRRDPVLHRDLRGIAAQPLWEAQRMMWLDAQVVKRDPS